MEVGNIKSIQLIKTGNKLQFISWIDYGEALVPQSFCALNHSHREIIINKSVLSSLKLPEKQNMNICFCTNFPPHGIIFP